MTKIHLISKAQKRANHYPKLDIRQLHDQKTKKAVTNLNRQLSSFRKEITNTTRIQDCWDNIKEIFEQSHKRKHSTSIKNSKKGVDD